MKYHGKDMDNKKQTVIYRIIENIRHVNVHIYKYIKIKVRYDIISLNFILLFLKEFLPHGQNTKNQPKSKHLVFEVSGIRMETPFVN